MMRHAIVVGALTALLAAPAQASDGTWDRAFGRGVDASQVETGFEICTTAASCIKGAPGGLGGEFGNHPLLGAALGLATDVVGSLYVADTWNHRVQKLGADGTFVLAFGKDVVAGGGTGFEVCTVAAACKAGAAGGLGGELRFPAGVAVDATGDIFVADTENQRIQRFGSDGSFERAFGKDVLTGGGTGFEICTDAAACQQGTDGDLGGELRLPADVATGTAGGTPVLYVADTQNNRIQRFDPDGVFQRTWGKDVVAGGGTGLEVCTAAASCTQGDPNGGAGGTIAPAASVAVDAAGRVLVAEPVKQRIERFSADGEFQLAFGADVVTGGGTGAEVCTDAATCKAGVEGGLGGELRNPTSVTADAAAWIHVGDRTNHRVQRFSAAGAFDRAYGKDVLTGGGTGFEVCTVAGACKQGAEGQLGGELDIVEDVAAAPGDRLYVADLDNFRVQRFGVADTTAPETTITGGPDGATTDPMATFTFTSSELGSTFVCSVDGAAPGSCSSPFSAGPLAAGAHTFAVQARDPAGNLDPTPATRSFTITTQTVDTTPPETTITDGPSGATSDGTPTFAFAASEAGSTFVCGLDDAPPAPCASPVTVGPLAAGAHRFAVQARDPAGNLDPTAATRDFTVVAPVVVPPPDRTPPGFAVRPAYDPVRDVYVSVVVICPQESCVVRATGRLIICRRGWCGGREARAAAANPTFTLKAVTRRLRRGQRATLRLKPSAKARAAVRRALRQRRQVRLDVRLRVTDAAGNTRVKTTTVKVRHDR